MFVLFLLHSFFNFHYNKRRMRKDKGEFMEAKQIIDAAAMQRMLTRLSYEIIERNKGLDDVVLIGIKNRGSDIAVRIAQRLQELEGMAVPVTSIDITPYRDDNREHHFEKTEYNQEFDVTNKKVVLVDDVLFTGRTIRAALDAVMDLGRPKQISLAILIDRGHRELPIRADYVGKNIPTSREEKVLVQLKETDGQDGIYLVNAN